jgi:hypothetical protein
MNEISDYLREQRRKWASKEPIIKPLILSDETANMEKREAAEETYSAALLARNPTSLTNEEQSYLLRSVRAFLGKG